jgi:hypothetical protein
MTTRSRYPFMAAIVFTYIIMNDAYKVFLLNATVAVSVLVFFIAVLSSLILLTMLILSSIEAYYAIHAIQASIGAMLVSCFVTVLFLTKGLMPMYYKLLP